jgi:hypothetical protein
MKVRNRYFNYVVVIDDESNIDSKRTAKGICTTIWVSLIETDKEEDFDSIEPNYDWLYNPEDVISIGGM